MYNKINSKDGTVTFMRATILFIVVSILMQLLLKGAKRENVVDLLPNVIAGYIAIFLPVIAVMRKKKLNIKKTFRFNKITPKQLSMCFVIFFCSYFVTLFLSIVTMFIFKLFGKGYQAQNIPTPSNGTELAIALIIIAVIPAIVEDMFFRGFMLSACQNKGIGFGALCTGLAFSLMHFNSFIFLPILYIGIIFALAVYYTNSIWAGVFMHFCYNATGVLIKYAVGLSTNNELRKAAEEGQEKIATGTLAVQMVIFGFIAAGALIVTYLIIDKMRSSYLARVEGSVEEKSSAEKPPLYKLFDAPMITVVVIYIGFPYIARLLSAVIK